MDPAPTDPARPLAAAHAHAFLAELLQRAVPPAVDAVTCAEGGHTILVMRYPTSAGGRSPGLSPCAVDCLRLLASRGERLTAERLRDELEARRIGIHSIATVKRSLKRLRELGLVRSSHCSPRGYHLADIAPSHQGPAA